VEKSCCSFGKLQGLSRGNFRGKFLYQGRMDRINQNQFIQRKANLQSLRKGKNKFVLRGQGTKSCEVSTPSYQIQLRPKRVFILVLVRNEPSDGWHQETRVDEKTHLSCLNLPSCNGLKSFLTTPSMRAECTIPLLP
jgi:hypothetical protein